MREVRDSSQRFSSDTQGISSEWSGNTTKLVYKQKSRVLLVETVANKKGFKRSEKKSSHWLKQLANGKRLRGLGDLQEVNEFFLFAVKGIQRFDESRF